MSRQNAIDFIKLARTDKDLRSRFNKAADNAERRAILQEIDLEFNYPEFEDAFNNMLGNCQIEEQADDLRNFKLWYDYITNT